MLIHEQVHSSISGGEALCFMTFYIYFSSSEIQKNILWKFMKASFFFFFTYSCFIFFVLFFGEGGINDDNNSMES